jgi:hypothetical protein
MRMQDDLGAMAGLGRASKAWVVVSFKQARAAHFGDPNPGV